MSFLSETISQIRDWTSEPSSNAKWTDAKLVAQIHTAYHHVLSEVQRVSRSPIICSLLVSVVADQTRYYLPPSIGSILCIQRLDSDGNILWYHFPTDHKNQTYRGFVLEGNSLNFFQSPSETYTLRLIYLPDNCFKLHTYEITVDAANMVDDTDAADNNCVVTLPTAANITASGTGTLDTRPNAYVGAVFRLLDNNTPARSYEIDRIIIAHDITTREITVSPAYDTFRPTNADVVKYEIVPLFHQQMLAKAVAMYVSKEINGTHGEPAQYSITKRLYENAVRDCRLKESHYDMVVGRYQRLASVHTNQIRGPLQRLDQGYAGAVLTAAG